MNVKQYIDSGALEAFVTGVATPSEEQEVLFLKERYPEVRQALNQLETDLENMAQAMAVPAPPNTWFKIEAEINSLIAQEARTQPFTEQQSKQRPNYNNAPGFIDVEVASSHMRVHKSWKWIFAAVFVLGKIFLACAIYFYLENRQAQLQIQEMKQEIKELRP